MESPYPPPRTPYFVSMTSRRDFMRQGGAALGASFLAGSSLAAIPRLLGASPAPDLRALEMFADIPGVKELMNTALNAAKMAGASYADVRCSRQRQNFVFTREQQIQQVVDTDTVGIGVRALVDGTWGFAATRVLTKDGAAAAAREQDDVVMAERAIKDAFATDVRPFLAEYRASRGLPRDPLVAFRESGYVARVAAERGAGKRKPKGGSSYA